MSKTSHDVKLVYFDARGRAEIIRLALALAEQKYEDVRCTRDDWPKYKPEAPFGQAPYMIYDGKKMGQSNAIARFIANEHDFGGKTNQDRLRVDEVLDLVGDLTQSLVKIFLEKDEAEKEKLKEKSRTEDLPKFFGFFQGLLKENKDSNSDLFVGKELTLADLQVFNIAFNVKKMSGYDAGSAFPEIAKLIKKVEDNPLIKTYLANRKETEM